MKRRRWTYRLSRPPGPCLPELLDIQDKLRKIYLDAACANCRRDKPKMRQNRRRHAVMALRRLLAAVRESFQ